MLFKTLNTVPLCSSLLWGRHVLQYHKVQWVLMKNLHMYPPLPQPHCFPCHCLHSALPNWLFCSQVVFCLGTDLKTFKGLLRCLCILWLPVQTGGFLCPASFAFRIHCGFTCPVSLLMFAVIIELKNVTVNCCQLVLTADSAACVS